MRPFAAEPRARTDWTSHPTYSRLPTSRVVITRVARPDLAEVAALRRLCLAALADVVGKDCVLKPRLVSVTPGLRLCGPAVTCRASTF